MEPEKRHEDTTRIYILEQRPRLDIRKYTFCNRVPDSWNILPNYVTNDRSVLDFERKLNRV